MENSKPKIILSDLHINELLDELAESIPCQDERDCILSDEELLELLAQAKRDLRE